MSLLDRLRAMNGGRPVAPPPVVRRHAGIETVIDGREIATRHGPAFLVERRWPLDHHHGWPVGGLAGHGGRPLGDLLGDARLAQLEPARAVVLDTETTGLAGGTGTYTFLIGLGLVEEGAFVVRQLFLRQLSEEPAVLAVLAEQLADCGGLVTYNGRSFDWPLLTTRFIMARQRQALPELPHWDVLPMARRLWRGRLGSCSLSALEEQVLGQPRLDDTPGWLIPQLYFDYLRDGDGRRLRGVFEHNQRDILALAALAGLICRSLEEPLGGPLVEAQDLAALAQHAEARGRPEAALELYRAALAGRLPVEHREAVQRALSLVLKRLGQWAEAEAVWLAMAGQPLREPAFPLLELAKHYEHGRRDYARASQLIERLLLTDQLRGASEERPALEHRLARLRRRLAQAADRPPGSAPGAHDAAGRRDDG